MFKSTLLAIFILFPYLGLANTPVFSQDYQACDSLIEKQTNNNLWDNWFICVGADLPTSKNSEIHSAGVNNKPKTITEWRNSHLGVRAMYSTLSVKRASWNNTNSTMSVKDTPTPNHPYDLLTLHADILFNASNLVCDYKEQRIWNIISTRKNEHGEKSAIGINLNIEGTYVGFRTNKNIPTKKQLKNISATLGFTYDAPDQPSNVVEIPIGDSERWNEHCNKMLNLYNEQ